MQGGYAFGNIQGDVVLNGIKVPLGTTPSFQLPYLSRDFTGRKSELAIICDLLENSLSDKAMGIFSIVGMAGVGKSALALTVAHHIKSNFPDTQLYVDMRGKDNKPRQASEVLKEWLRALGMNNNEIPEKVGEKATCYRTRMVGKRAIVLIDNAHNQEQIQYLLPGSENCVVIATSRKSMSELAGIEEIQLKPLGFFDSLEFLSKLVGKERVQTELEAAKEIIELCGCLPLAIRISGGQLRRKKHWSLKKDYLPILSHAKKNLDYFTHGYENNIRASFNLSYADTQLSDRFLFTTLGVLPADFDIEIVEEVLSKSENNKKDSVQILERLVDIQLIEAIGKQRYRYHNLMRIFARELLSEVESKEAQRVCFQWYLRKAKYWKISLEPYLRKKSLTQLCQEISDDEWESSSIVVPALNWIKQERVNLLSALEWANEK